MTSGTHPRPGDDTVLTPRSPRVVAARRLTTRAERTASGQFLAEGSQAVREAVAAGVVAELFCTPPAAERYGDLVARWPGRPRIVSERAAAGLSETVHPQGIVAVCRAVHLPLEAALTAGSTLAVLLAEINDPGNAGTVLRTADAAGARAVLFGAGSVDPYNGKCVRASAGSLFHLGLVRDAVPADAVDAARAAGLRVLAADGDGERDLDEEVDSGGLAAATMWVFGNEAR
ncbi:MAG: RNA methyltransferase, partial [Geodermatophilaceae bacterium]|nr:RNA methyltransferase [Geodermatophilaceae bacterium]